MSVHLKWREDKATALWDPETKVHIAINKSDQMVFEGDGGWEAVFDDSPFLDSANPDTGERIRFNGQQKVPVRTGSFSFDVEAVVQPAARVVDGSTSPVMTPTPQGQIDIDP